MIKVLKLVTGEELIGDINFNDGMYSIEDPIIMYPTKEGYAFIPFMPYSKESEFFFKASNVVTEVEINDELTNKYREQFGSGIQVVRNQILG